MFEVIFHNQKLLDILGLDSDEELNVMVNKQAFKLKELRSPISLVDAA